MICMFRSANFRSAIRNFMLAVRGVAHTMALPHLSELSRLSLRHLKKIEKMTVCGHMSRRILNE